MYLHMMWALVEARGTEPPIASCMLLGTQLVFSKEQQMIILMYALRAGILILPIPGHIYLADGWHNSSSIA